MNRDPFYIQIVEGLTRQLDPELFEQCAADLLRSIYPGLTPVRGGSDSGMDGAIGDNRGEPFPLVTTTGDDVIGNLTRNLETYKQNGGTRRVAVLATSCDLTPRKKKNLYARARELDFELTQIHDQAAFADLLYNSPRWCLELLNLPSTPPPLSKIPKTERPFLNAPLVGREASLEWLRQTSGDRLLLGQPGSGKTFLLHKLSEEDKGLFLISREPGEIAAGIRAQKPTAIFVDDAGRDRELLITLRQMRQEMGLNFEIIATGWPGEKDGLTQSLNLPATQVHSLEQLTRDEIVEVIHGAGVVGPKGLIKEIVDQAEGRPGLAVTLTLLCLQGGVRDVVFGDFLSNFILDFAKRFVDEKSRYILAILSLAGDQGLTIEKLSQISDIPILDVHRMVNQLSASGVILQVWGNQLTVRPPTLRFALIRNTFFAEVGLPIKPILDQLPNHYEAAHSLMGARRRGASVPDVLLRTLVSELGMPNIWEDYASLGRNEAEWAFEQLADFLQPIAAPGLENAPELYLPALLNSCVKDKRPLNSNPDHFLRLIEDWVKSPDPERSVGLENRQTLLKVVEEWLINGGNWSVGCQALQYVMSPDFENSSTDPGAGRQVSIRHGILSLENLNKIKLFWPRILGLLDRVDIDDWSILQRLVESWAYPGRFGVSMPDDMYNSIKSFAEQMLRDVVIRASQHPGVLYWAKGTSENCGYDLQIEIDDDFQILYPLRSREENLTKQQDEWNILLAPLVDRWISKDPKTVAKDLAHIENEARIANITWPRLTPSLCFELAKKTPKPLSWARAFRSVDLSIDLIHPFLQKSIEIKEHGWDEFFTKNIVDRSLQGSIIPLILTSADPPEQLLTGALENLDDSFVDWVRSALTQGRVPEAHTSLLLNHSSALIAFAAAEGEWLADPKGTVRTSLRKIWEDTIVRYDIDDVYGNNTFWLSEILEADPELAYRWLENFLKKDNRPSGLGVRRPTKAALACLAPLARLNILKLVPNEYGFDTFILDLVNRSPDIYKGLLSLPHLKDYHLVPLSGNLDDIWMELVTLASNAGYSPDDIAAATMMEYSEMLTNMDGEADRWSKWINEFEETALNDNELVKKICEAGITIAKKRFDDNQRRLRSEAIYGWQ